MLGHDEEDPDPDDLSSGPASLCARSRRLRASRFWETAGPHNSATAANVIKIVFSPLLLISQFLEIFFLSFYFGEILTSDLMTNVIV